MFTYSKHNTFSLLISKDLMGYGWMEIGKKIKNLRKKKGLTLEELGERTDLTKGYISQVERGLKFTFNGDIFQSS